MNELKLRLFDSAIQAHRNFETYEASGAPEVKIENLRGQMENLFNLIQLSGYNDEFFQYMSENLTIEEYERTLYEESENSAEAYLDNTCELLKDSGGKVNRLLAECKKCKEFYLADKYKGHVFNSWEDAYTVIEQFTYTDIEDNGLSGVHFNAHWYTCKWGENYEHEFDFYARNSEVFE